MNFLIFVEPPREMNANHAWWGSTELEQFFFRKLSYENRRLQQTMERELHERKKLSQENEELHYKIRQSFCLDGSQLSTRYYRLFQPLGGFVGHFPLPKNTWCHLDSNPRLFKMYITFNFEFYTKDTIFWLNWMNSKPNKTIFLSTEVFWLTSVNWIRSSFACFHCFERKDRHLLPLTFGMKRLKCLKTITNFSSLIDYSSSTNPMFASLQQQSSLSASYTAESGCPQSLPHFSGRSVDEAIRRFWSSPGKEIALTISVQLADKIGEK